VYHGTRQRPDCLQWEIDLLGDIDPVVRLSSAVELGRRQAAEAASALVVLVGRLSRGESEQRNSLTVALASRSCAT